MSDELYPGFEPVPEMEVVKTGNDRVEILVDDGAEPAQVTQVQAAILRSHPRWTVRVMATFHVDLSTCPICGNWMLDQNISSVPAFWRYAGKAEIRRTHGYNSLLSQVVCNQCAEKQYRENFECGHCYKVQPMSEVQYKYDRGYGTGYLCKTCYNTLTAAEWDIAVKELEQSHAWTD